MSDEAGARDGPGVGLCVVAFSKGKTKNKGKVTVQNTFEVDLTVALLDYDEKRTVSAKSLPRGQTIDIARTTLCGVRFTFDGSDGHIMVIKVWPAAWGENRDWSEQWHLHLDRQTGTVSATKTCSWADALGSRRFSSEKLGVGVAYLLESFGPDAQKATGEESPDFHCIAPHLAFGERALGFGKACPRDGRPNCSIVDGLPPGSAGRATHFLSWAWSYTLGTFLSAIGVWVEDCRLRQEETFLWVCFFCNNQFRILEEQSQEGSDNLEQAFTTRLTEIGKVVVLFDSWSGPRYLQRAWCVFETFMADKVGAELEIILPSQEAVALTQQIRGGGMEHVIDAFRKVDIERAKATRAVDEARVKEAIAKSSSYERVNQVVKDRLVAWCTSQFTSMVEEAVTGGDQSAGPGSELASENIRLRETVRQMEGAIAKLQAEHRRVQSQAAEDHAELQRLRALASDVHRMCAEAAARQKSGSDPLLEKICGKLQHVSRGIEERGQAPNASNEMESLMDEIISEIDIAP